MNDLVVYRPAVPTFLIESIQAQLKPTVAKAQGVQAIRFTDVGAIQTL